MRCEDHATDLKGKAYNERGIYVVKLQTSREVYVGQSSVDIEDRHTHALPSRRAHCLDAANHWTILNAAIAKQNGKEVRRDANFDAVLCSV